MGYPQTISHSEYEQSLMFANFPEANWSLIPGYMHNGVFMFVEHGICSGGFLTALFSNDLKGAVRAGDDTNKNLLPSYVIFMANYMPAQSQGSPEAFVKWKQQGGLRGLYRKAQAEAEEYTRLQQTTGGADA